MPPPEEVTGEATHNPLNATTVVSFLPQVVSPSTGPQVVSPSTGRSMSVGQRLLGHVARVDNGIHFAGGGVRAPVPDDVVGGELSIQLSGDSIGPRRNRSAEGRG